MGGREERGKEEKMEGGGGRKEERRDAHCIQEARKRRIEKEGRRKRNTHCVQEARKIRIERRGEGGKKEEKYSLHSGGKEEKDRKEGGGRKEMLTAFRVCAIPVVGISTADTNFGLFGHEDVVLNAGVAGNGVKTVVSLQRQFSVDDAIQRATVVNCEGEERVGGGSEGVSGEGEGGRE